MTGSRGVERAGLLATSCAAVLLGAGTAAIARNPPDAPQAPAASTDAAPPPASGEETEVVVDGDRVTASFSQVPPETIVAEIARAAGAEVVGAPEGGEPTSIELDDTPIVRALERALGGQSFTLVYGGDGSVRRIRLHGGPQEAPAGGQLAKRPTSAGARVMPHQLFDVQVQVPSVGPLAEHLGSQTATLGQLYRIAIDEDQAALRIAAVDAGMAAIETDANLQGGIDSLLESTDDAALAGLVRGSAGKRANELVSRILSRTRRPQVRQRAVTILRALREPTN